MVHEVLIPHAQVLQRVDQLGEEILANLKDPQNTVLVKVLEGASRFGPALNDAFYRRGVNMHEASIRASSYGGGQRSNKDPKITVLFEQDTYRGMHALIVDDVFESGWTIDKTKRVLEDFGGFLSFTFVCLLLKQGMSEVPTQADYVGFTIGQEWIDGFGIDTNGMNRACPDIMVWR